MPTSVQPPLDDSKILEACQTLAQSISQWDLLIIAGSIVIIIGTSYYRPTRLFVRAAYFLFIPAWAYLAASIYQGILVQRSYVAYLFGAHSKSQTTTNQIFENIANSTRDEITYLEIALVIVPLWLIIYLSWWIFSKESGGKHHV
jgi:hypothetical protein